MASDYTRPSTWVKYKESLCLSCVGSCCRLPVEVYKKDLIRLGLTDEFEYQISPKKLAKRLMKEKIVRSFNSKEEVFILEQNGHSECIMLGKDKMCSVYEKRPDTCRNHPIIGPRPGYCAYNKKK